MRNVIFDLDGTLVDSLPGIRFAVEGALADCGLGPLACDLRPLIGPPIREILSSVSGAGEAHVLDRMTARFRVLYDSEGWRMTNCQPGAREVVETLYGMGCHLWVVTNKPAGATRAILDELDLAKFFEDVACRNSPVRSFQSKADVLTDLLQRCTINRSDCIMVGDTLEDCLAAEGAGIECMIVPHGYGKHESPLPGKSRRIAGWKEVCEWGMGSETDEGPSQPAKSERGRAAE